MDTQFWIRGIMISAVSHGLILAVFLVFGTGERQETAEDMSPQREESVQEGASAVSKQESSSEPEASPEPAASSVREYEVKAGDTLGAIARRIGCSVERLAEVDGSDVKTLSRLRIGQRLVLPD